MSDEKPTLFTPGVGERGMTELHYAAYCGDQAELIRCLAAGMDPNKKDTYRGYTPVLWLADMAAVGGPRIELLRALVKHGADICITAADGTTALTLAREAGTAPLSGLGVFHYLAPMTQLEPARARTSAIVLRRVGSYQKPK
jgi:ankyrin repeat protein